MSSGGTRSGGYRPEDREKVIKARYKKVAALPTPSSDELEANDDSFRSADGDIDIDIAQINMAFDSEDGTDDAGAHSKLASVKVTYDQSDLDFFFINLEAAMSYAGIKSQMS